MQTILVLDDDVNQLDEFAGAFRSAGFNVVPAVTGRQALELAAASSFDAIVSDLVLPDISGLDVLKVLRDSNNPTPVIVVTAFQFDPLGCVGSVDTQIGWAAAPVGAQARRWDALRSIGGTPRLPLRHAPGSVA